MADGYLNSGKERKVMNTLKKVFAIVISMTMLVTGLYLLPADADKVQATGTVATPPDGVLNVKAQTTKTLVDVEDKNNENYQYNGMYVLRMISSIDCLNYRQVGFRVTYVDETSGEEKEMWDETDRVYKRIASTTDVAEYSFSPKVIDTEAEYFITAKLAVPADKTDRVYTVQAFCDPLGGGQRVYGPKRCVAVDDAAESILSFGVDATLSTQKDAYTATVTSQVNTDEAVVTKNGTVEVLSSENGYANVRVTLTDGIKAALASVSKVSIQQNGEEVASTTYRNYDTSYLSGTYAGKPDTSWYDLQPAGDTQYVLATNADLYGLSVVSQTDNFDGDTIHLIADIKANIGTAKSTGWEKAEGGTEYNWTPMSNANMKFAGTFDGNLHTIEGIRAINTENSTETNHGFVGLFSETAPDSNIKELLVKNSYFSKSGSTSDVYSSIGSIVGHSGSNLEKVYSDGFIVAANKVLNCGGLVGEVYTTTSVTMKECNFSGSVVSSSANGNGGLIGQTKRGSIVLQDCINNGSNTATSWAGGLIGRSYMIKGEYGHTGDEDRDVWTITVENCLVTGSMTSSAVAFISQKWGGVKTWGLPNVYMLNTVTTKDSVLSDSTGRYTNSRTVDQLTGTNAYQWLSFDFENVWTVVDNDYPIQQCFAETIVENDFMPRMGWYNSKLTEYTISTAEELYGVSELNNNHNSGDNIFTGKTIYLGDDIEVNAGTVAEWEENEFSDLRQWTPIGTTKAFRGNFNGNGKTISGLYMSGAGKQSLFGNAYGTNITLENFNLVNTYITSTGGWNASVAGNFRGNVMNVYSNAEINVGASTGNYETGGIIARVDSAATTISNCWYAGNITTQASAAGGIVGYYANAVKLTIENCHVSGRIKTNMPTKSGGLTNAGLGGFVGKVYDSATQLDIKNSLLTGTIEQGPKTNSSDGNRSHIGLFTGQVSAANCKFTITNTYYPNNTTLDPLGYVDNSNTINEIVYASNKLKQDAMIALCKKWSTSSTVEELGLDATAWKDSTNGPILSAFEVIHTSVNSGN